MTGEIEIIPNWDADHAFAVFVWGGPGRDSGYMAKAFATRQRAIDFAEGMVEASDLTLQRAEILDFARGAE